MSELVSAFDLAAAVVREHERGSAGTIRVVPIVVDNLESALTVLHPVCELAGGALLNAEDPALARPVPGTDDPVRRSAIEAALRASTGSGVSRTVHVVDLPDEHIDVEFRDPPTSASPSPGESTVLAVARAVAHQQLDTRELVVIAYRESLLDLHYKQAVWDLGVRHLRGMPHPSLKTIVFVAEGALDIRRHCDTEFGFRLALDGPRLLRRQGIDDLRHWAAKLAREPNAIVFFLGAGFAASSRLPLGNGLRDQAIRRLLGMESTDPSSSAQLANRFYDWVAPKSGWLTASESGLSREVYTENLTLEQVVRAESRVYADLPTLAAFRSHHDSVVGTPGSAVLDLAEILRLAGPGRIVLTEVNFDLLVETHSPVPLRVFSSEAEFEEAADYITDYLAGTESAVPLLKLHGTIDDPATCVVSAEQTERGVSRAKLAALRALLPVANGQSRLWLYIGASMRDHDLTMVYSSPDFAKGLDELWVAPYLADTVERYMLSRLPFWRGGDRPGTDDRLISVTADQFFAALRAAHEVV